MKTMYINSYYSDIDYVHDCFNGIDGLYVITYPDNCDLKKAIKETTERIYNSEWEVQDYVSKLSDVLDYMKEFTDIQYMILQTERYDCDYHSFDKE